METRSIKSIPVELSYQKLKERCEADLGISTCDVYFSEAQQIFRAYCESEDLWEPHCPLIDRPADDKGQEHSVWYEPSDCCYYKLTHPGFFGLNVIYRDETDRDANPIEYQHRWVLHNYYFGDSIEFLGAYPTPQGLSLLIRQPAIRGKPASLEEIRDFFRQPGWIPLKIGNEIAYFIPEENVVISDTHRGNLVKMPNGLLAPIDLRMQAVHGALLDAVLAKLGAL